MKDYSVCHQVEVESKEKADGVTVEYHSVCTKCGKKCDVFHGTLKEARTYKPPKG